MAQFFVTDFSAILANSDVIHELEVM